MADQLKCSAYHYQSEPCKLAPDSSTYLYSMKGVLFRLTVYHKRPDEPFVHIFLQQDFITAEERERVRLESLPTIPQRKPIYLLQEWERNERDDSDFMGIIFDTNTGKLETVQLGTTRFGAPSCCNGMVCYCGLETDYFNKRAPLPPEVAEKARLQLKESIRRAIIVTDKNEIEGPFHSWNERWHDINANLAGQELALFIDHRFMTKDQEKCRKCGGTGEWVNPRKDTDKRQCFTCGGTGEVTSRSKRKSADGKPIWDNLKAGTVVTFIELMRFSFYTASAKVRLADNRTVRIPPEKLRLNRAPLSEDEVERRAEDYSRRAPWSFVSGRHVLGAVRG